MTPPRPAVHTLELPWSRPPLTANQRLHWPARARLTAEIRATVAWIARQHRIGRHHRVRVALHYTPATRRRRDSDNLAPTYKAIVDGLTDADVIPDDTDRHVLRDWPLIHDPDPHNPRLTLEVEPLPAAQETP